MATTKQPQTKVIDTVKVSTIKNKAEFEKKHGVRFGSPINSKNEGDEFDVTLTGDVEIREFNGNKGAYFTTKEGYSIRVNASFDAAKHKENTTHKAICRVFNDEANNRTVKFTAFAE